MPDPTSIPVVYFGAFHVTARNDIGLVIVTAIVLNGVIIKYANCFNKKAQPCSGLKNDGNNIFVEIGAL